MNETSQICLTSKVSYCNYMYCNSDFHIMSYLFLIDMLFDLLFLYHSECLNETSLVYRSLIKSYHRRGHLFWSFLFLDVFEKWVYDL